MSFDELREDYQGDALRKRNCANDPTEQFRRWFEDATEQKIEMANAMTLATVDSQGAPHARIVLLKDFDSQGFVFYTNYESAKGTELSACNRASLLFYWHGLHRQVRIDGEVSKVDSRTSDEYFATRPRDSNIVAIASLQSEALASRDALLSQIATLRARVGSDELVRPAHWGGYRLKAHLLEFWQGQPDRSHDRIQYRLDSDSGWGMTRLSP